MIVLLGPTSTGKTSLAIKMCQIQGGEIISADSRQVYKYMDIGTGKVPVSLQGRQGTQIKRLDDHWEVDNIKIWGYDLVRPDEYFSAADFYKYAIKKIDKIKSRNRKVFLVGGTGFYIDVVTGRIKLSGAKPDTELRKALQTTPTKTLLFRLKRADQNAYNKIDKNNRVRIIRAVEKSLQIVPADDVLKRDLPSVGIEDIVGLTSDRSLLYKRADDWADEIWEPLLEETSRLIEMGYADSIPLQGLVYKTVVEHRTGGLSKEDALQRIKFDLHAYIRRQLTWFRKNRDIQWIDISDRMALENYAQRK